MLEHYLQYNNKNFSIKVMDISRIMSVEGNVLELWPTVYKILISASKTIGNYWY